MKRRSVIFIILIILASLFGILFMFFTNPSAPQTKVTKELQLDHINKCVKV